MIRLDLRRLFCALNAEQLTDPVYRTGKRFLVADDMYQLEDKLKDLDVTSQVLADVVPTDHYPFKVGCECYQWAYELPKDVDVLEVMAEWYKGDCKAQVMSRLSDNRQWAPCENPSWTDGVQYKLVKDETPKKREFFIGEVVTIKNTPHIRASITAISDADERRYYLIDRWYRKEELV